jgi:cell wall-associated NlpC family hydrolase
MKRLYVLLFSITLLSSYGMANAKKIDSEDNKNESKKGRISSSKLITYTINSGDTLPILAKKYNTTVKKIAWINNLSQDLPLQSGHSIKIPVKTHIYEQQQQDDLGITLASVIEKIEKSKEIESHKQKSNSHKIVQAPKTKKQKIASINISPEKKLAANEKAEKTTLLNSISSGKTSTLELAAAKKQLGKRYVWGATGPRAFDCSGFTSYVCKKSGVNIPRTSIKQSKVGKRVDRKNLKPGDLVFFDTSKKRRGYINHVGIYLGNNKFIHASSAKKKVVIASLEKPFYKARFKWGSRVKS